MEILDEIFEMIDLYNRIIIHRHVRADLDALGSQVGLAKWLTAHFPEKEIYCVGEEDDSLTYLATMDSIDDDKFDDALIIVCDTANHPRIDDQRYKLGKQIIKIDHHPIVDQYGDLNWVDTDASSTSEMIYKLISSYKTKQTTLTKEVARLLFAGIVGDTGRFIYPSTTPKTFEIASKLVQYPFDRSEIFQNMYELDLRIAKFKGHLLDQLEVDEVGVVAVKLKKELLESYQVTADETSSLVHIFGEIKGINCWAMFVEEEDQIRVRIRSKQTKINQVAEQFNGGGHPLASGATVYTWDEAEQLISELKKTCQTQIK